MNHEEYLELTKRVAHLVERGEYQDAVKILRDLLIEDISDVDKSMMCVNLAVVFDKLDSPDEALDWYERGVDYERRHGGHFVAESRAAYLAELGRAQESLAHYQDLLKHPGLAESDKARVRENIELLQKGLR